MLDHFADVSVHEGRKGKNAPASKRDVGTLYFIGLWVQLLNYQPFSYMHLLIYLYILYFSHLFYDSNVLSKVLYKGLGMFVALPLSLLRNIESLQYICTTSILFYLVVVFRWDFPQPYEFNMIIMIQKVNMNE